MKAPNVLAFFVLISIASMSTCLAQEGATNAGNDLPRHEGKAVPCNTGSSFLDDTKAASSGDRKAMYTLGCRYERGDGTEKALAKAIVWYRKAASAGSTQGMNRLGEIYRDGDDGAKDYGKAQSWFKRAAAGGSSDAMNNLGLLYSYQRNFPPDYKAALDWFQRSAKLGNSEAINNLGMMYLEARGVTRSYVTAREWFERAAALNNNSGRIDLGYLYQLGLGVTEDIPKAIQLYETAAAEEHPQAIEMLGQLYRDGTGVPKDLEKARQYFEKAAELNDTGAMYSLGEMYDGSRGFPRDPAKAKYWYERAASRADQSLANQWVSEWAMERLGDSYQSGIFTERNYQTSLDWFRKAAQVFNSPNAMDRIAGFYEYGYGVPKDAVEAQKWHARATALRPPPPPVTPQCAEYDLETKLRVFDQLGRHAIAIEKRNLTKAACKLGNYTLAPNQVAHAWRMWRTRADDGSTAGCHDLSDNHYLNGVSIASPTLLPPVCSGLEVHDFADGPFVPYWTAYNTAPMPPPPNLTLSIPKTEYLEGEHVRLRLNVDGIDAVTPKTDQGCPVFLRTVISSTGLIRIDEMTPVTPDISGSFLLAINCHETAFHGPQNHEFEFNENQYFEQKVSYKVHFFTLAGRSPQGEIRLVESNSTALVFKDPAEIPRQWGPTEQGVRVDLTLDKTRFQVGEDIAAHIAVQVVDSKEPVFGEPFVRREAFFPNFDGGFHLSILDANASPEYNDHSANLYALPSGSSGPIVCPPALKVGKVIPLERSLRDFRLLPTRPGTYQLSVTWSPYHSRFSECPDQRPTPPEQPFVTARSNTVTITIVDKSSAAALPPSPE